MFVKDQNGSTKFATFLGIFYKFTKFSILLGFFKNPTKFATFLGIFLRFTKFAIFLGFFKKSTKFATFLGILIPPIYTIEPDS